MSPQGSPQPTWSFEIRVLPSDLYMGEWGRVCVNITNVGCAKRMNVNLEFGNIPGDYLDELVRWAKPMLEIKLIENYAIQIRG